ncbi:MAG: DUF3568 family protein, partial [Gemmatimonadetes bacterium]|nr:DUF3568 family protein [Gemmatimonadota bacterium]
VLAACAAAVGGAAGAGTALYLTDRGAKTTVSQPLSQASRRTEATFRELGITPTKTETERGEREYHGVKGDMDVKVELKSRGANTTEVEVLAQKNAVQWDKDYAKSVLARIVGAG